MNTIVNLFAKLSGAGKVWDFLDGKKSYLAGSIGILSGAAGLLGEVLKLIADKDVAAVWAFAKNLPQDQYLLTIAAGLAAVGLRHAIEKQEPAPAP